MLFQRELVLCSSGNIYASILIYMQCVESYLRPCVDSVWRPVYDPVWGPAWYPVWGPIYGWAPVGCARWGSMPVPERRLISSAGGTSTYVVPERRVARPGAPDPLGSTYGCPGESTNLRVSGMVAACPRPRKRGIRVGVLEKGTYVGGIQCAPNGVAGKSRSWAQVRNGVH